MSESSDKELIKIIDYIKNHWPSKIKSKWQVRLEEYPQLLSKIIEDFVFGATKNRRLIRISGISGSGKTSQILPAAEAYCEKNNLRPVLIAARRFVEYHPHYQEIKDFYGAENLRKNTDDFSTILLFLTLTKLIECGYDIILDVALLDPEMEEILLKILTASNYEALFLMIAVSPTVTEYFLQNRSWRHTKQTEEEFICATEKALGFYAKNAPDFRIILWSVYDEPPIYDGPINGCLKIFADYSERQKLPEKDDDARRAAKIKYLTTGSD